MSTLLPCCLRCQWRMRNFRARSDSWCSKHEMIIHDTLGTFCHELENLEHPELAAFVARENLARPGIYVWLLFFREVAAGIDEAPYYHEPAYLVDVATYREAKTTAILRDQQALHAQIKAARAAGNSP